MSGDHCVREGDFATLFERTKHLGSDLDRTIKNDKRWKETMEQRVDDLSEAVNTLVVKVGDKLDDITVSKSVSAQIKGNWILGLCALAAALIGVFFG
jgi:hypothetical protein